MLPSGEEKTDLFLSCFEDFSPGLCLPRYHYYYELVGATFLSVQCEVVLAVFEEAIKSRATLSCPGVGGDVGDGDECSTASVQCSSFPTWPRG